MSAENPAMLPEGEEILSEAGENPELGPEKEKIFEGSRAERAKLLSKVFSRRTADVAGNLIPGIDVAKFTSEAIYGKTVAGKELSGRERINYAVIAGSIALAYALHFSGKNNEAITARAFASSVASIQMGPELLQAMALKAQERFPGVASLLQKSGEFLKDKGDLFEKAATGIKELLKNPELIAPNLNAE
jgi:hypothetical protein